MKRKDSRWYYRSVYAAEEQKENAANEISLRGRIFFVLRTLLALGLTILVCYFAGDRFRNMSLYDFVPALIWILVSTEWGARKRLRRYTREVEARKWEKEPTDELFVLEDRFDKLRKKHSLAGLNPEEETEYIAIERRINELEDQLSWCGNSALSRMTDAEADAERGLSVTSGDAR